MSDKDHHKFSDQQSSFTIHKYIYRNQPENLKSYLDSLPDNDQEKRRTILSELCRGQTPLTLAIQLNHKECIQILLDSGASVLTPNAHDWTPYQEAVSRGDRDVIGWIYRRRRVEYARWFDDHGKQILQQLSNDIQDLKVEMHWSFKSFIPFVSNLCPSDVYKIYKKGTSIRIDTSLVGFENLQWIRGDVSIIFKEEESGARLVICDHQRRLVQQIWPKDFTVTDKIAEEDISISLNTKINGRPDIDWSSFTLSRAQSGFFAFKYDKTESIGPWETHVWNIDSLDISCKVRREHLDAHPLPHFKILKHEEERRKREQNRPTLSQSKPTGGSRLVIANPESYGDSRYGSARQMNDTQDDTDSSSISEEDFDADNSDDEEARIRNYKPGYRNIMDSSTERDYREWRAARKAFKQLARFRPTLNPPNEPAPPFDVYFDPKHIKQYYHVGRSLDVEVTNQTLRATLWMYDPESTNTATNLMASSNRKQDLLPIQSPEFPIKISHITPFLDLIGMGTNEHIRALREFFHVQLPNGFPVQIEIPVNILPLSGVIRFQNVERSCDDVDERTFFHIPREEDGYRMGDLLSNPEFDDSYYLK